MSVASSESICTNTTNVQEDHVAVKLKVLAWTVATLYCLYQ